MPAARSSVFPVILCGGSGTRLWPASRPERPKQFLPLLGELSIFQDTVLRMRRLQGARPAVIVAGHVHLDAIRAQLAAIDEAGFILTEPEGRDSAPAIAAAASWIRSQDSAGIAVVVAADHHIPDAEAFCAAAEIAVAAANDGAIVTFGVQPSHPSTGYGYIEPGERLGGAAGVHKVRRFVEKPPADTAKAYVEAGYLWNSGNFVFRADRLLAELEEFAPELAAKVEAARTGGEAHADGLRLGPDFSACPKISIDYAVMEKTSRAAVVPVSYSWSDLGSWQAIHEASAQDAARNAVRGEARLRASAGCLVRSATDQLVTILGLDGVGVVVEPDAILVCSLAVSQEVKGLVDSLTVTAASALDPLKKALTDWLFASALPIWWSLGADHERGGFRETLDQGGRPFETKRRLRVQARQVYVYATAMKLGWTGPCRSAVEHGLDWLEAKHRREDGLYRTLVSPEGAALDDAALLYDQAFVLLALAAAAGALPDRRTELERRAAVLLDGVRRVFGHGAGGFREHDGERPHQANAQMHLFEAALNWTQESGDPRWRALADELGELCCARFIDPETSALREVFDADWRPAGGEPGRIVEPGHQFEWAWLLQQWSWISSRPEAAKIAALLFEVGEQGVDPARGVAQDSLYDDLSVRERSARLWPQTERLKAAHLLGRQAPAEAAAAALRRYADVLIPGLWRDRLTAEGRFVEESAPASSFYHLTAAIAELHGRRIANPPAKPA